MDGRERSRERRRRLREVRDGRALHCTPVQYRGDPEIVLTAVTQDGIALQYAAEECKADREIVLAA
eukprot:5195474-Amphidinium_carterae.1